MILCCAAQQSLPVLPLDDVKVGAPATEESTVHSSSMTVSSTTKLGDDGLVEDDFLLSLNIHCLEFLDQWFFLACQKIMVLWVSWSQSALNQHTRMLVSGDVFVIYLHHNS